MADNLRPPSFSLQGSKKTPHCSFWAASQSHRGGRYFPGAAPQPRPPSLADGSCTGGEHGATPNVQGMTSPKRRPRCSSVTCPDAVRPEKLDHLFGETRAEPGPQDHHVLSPPRTQHHRARRRGDLRRRWESGFGTILTRMVPAPGATRAGETLPRLCLGWVVTVRV